MTNLGIMASQISGHLYDGPYGAYDSLATVTLSASTASITFSGIPSGYKHLELRGISRINTGTEYVFVRLNGDSGANYSEHHLSGNGSTANAGGNANYNQMGIFFAMGTPSTANVVGANVTTILDYASSTKYKTMRSLDGFDANGSGGIELVSGLWQSLSPVTSFTLTPNSSASFVQYTQFALYGIK